MGRNIESNKKNQSIKYRKADKQKENTVSTNILKKKKIRSIQKEYPRNFELVFVEIG